MCLVVVHENEKKKRWGVGWKVVKVSKGEWIPPYCGGLPYKKKDWNEDSSTSRISYAFKHSYLTGFHIYPDPRDAKAMLCYVKTAYYLECFDIKKVRYMNVVCVGSELYGKVVVARQMKVVVARKMKFV